MLRCLNRKQRALSVEKDKKKLPGGSLKARLERFELPTL